MDNGLIIPPGYSPPFTVVTKNDHTAWIVVATLLSLGCSLLFGAIRIFLRSTSEQGFCSDDYFIGAATVVTVIQSAVILTASHHGLGKTMDLIPAAAMVKVQQLHYGSNLLHIIALGLSKLSVVQLCRRLRNTHRHKIAYNVLVGLATACGITSCILTARQCDLSRPWAVMDESCHGTLLRLRASCAFDILTEIALVSCAVSVIWGVQIPLTTKATVVLAFAWRLLLIAPIAFRLLTYREFHRATDFPFGDLFVVWTQVEVGWALITATVPTYRPFLHHLNTQFGGLTGEGAYAYGSHGKSSDKDKTGTDTIKMSNLGRTPSQIRNPPAKAITNHNPVGNRNCVGYNFRCPDLDTGSLFTLAQENTECENVTSDTRSAHSLGSEEHLVIVKQTTIQVEYCD